MAREAIDLGNPETLPSGKVRWQKQHRRQSWKSPVYDQDSRRNRAAAWTLFVEWRNQIDTQLNSERDTRDESHPVRKLLVDRLQEDIAVAQVTQDSKQEKWAKDVLAIVRETEETGLHEMVELLGIDDSPEQEAARIVVQKVARSIKRERQVLSSELMDEWLQFKFVDVQSGDLSPGGYTNQRRHVERFAEFCPNILDANGLMVEVLPGSWTTGLAAQESLQRASGV